ncbi:MAG: MBL fold metallo-hydrolase [Cyanothece sp. SIO1E1]|nr:MBL fold metallo-hydrolase [Cyanothece sp. SIO1E1]
MGPHKILLDCGLSDISPLIDPSQALWPVDLVLCSHAHWENSQGLMAFNQACPQVPIYASEVTTRLLGIHWPELKHIDRPPLCQSLPWQAPVELGSGLIVELWPAGHLPGAASFLLTYTTDQQTYTIFYTGDFLLSNSRLVEGFPLNQLRKRINQLHKRRPDVLITEASYGTARHLHRRHQENRVAEQIHQAIANQHSILLPTSALGLAQELLMLLRSHHHFTGRNLDIWVDDTIAAGCDAYLELLPYFPHNIQNFARHQSIFWDQRIRPRVRRLTTAPGASAPDANSMPCIVLADETSDLGRYCQPDQCHWHILLPQQPSTVELDPECQLLRCQPELTAQCFKTALATQQLTLDTYLLAEHCDGLGTTQLIHNLRPQHVLLIHGSLTYLSDLAGLKELQNRYHLHLPTPGVMTNLPLVEMSPLASTAENNYEGDLTDLDGLITVTLPNAIKIDPRWSAFSDTGLIEARWQGNELVLRSMSQRELLNRSHQPFVDPDIACCYNCQYYRKQHCWHPASSLFGFKASPDGYCLSFTPISAEPDDQDADSSGLEDEDIDGEAADEST